MQELSTSGKLVRNTFFNSMGMVWNGAIAFFTTPYMLHKLGDERYGLLGIAVAVTGYAYLLDFSIGQTFIKHFAEYNAHKDTDRMNRALNTTLAFYGLVCGAALLAAAFLTKPLLGALKVPPELHSEASFVIALSLITFALTSLFNVFSILQSGLQRLDLANKISIYISIPQTAALFFVLEKGYGLYGLMWRAAAVAVAYAVVNIWAAYKIFPELKVSWTFVDRGLLRTFLSFGLKLHIARLSGIITGQTDRILIGLMLSLTAVTNFQLGNTLVVTLSSLAGIMVSATTPAFSEIFVRHGKESVVEAYLTVTKYLSSFTVPAFALLMLSASLLLKLWVGPAYAGSAAIVIILSLGAMLNMLAQAGVSVCQSLDRPQLMAASSVLNMVMNIGLNILLISLFREKGIAWGSALGMVVSSCYFWYMLHRGFKMPLSGLLAAVLPFLESSVVAALPLLAIDFMSGPFLAASGRPGALLLLILRICIFAAVYFLWLARKNTFPPQEIDFLCSKFEALPVLGRFARLRRCGRAA